MTDKKKGRSKLELARELAERKHDDIQFVADGNIPTSNQTNELAVATNEGLYFYKYEKNQLIPLVHIRWEEVHSGKVDFLAFSTILTLNGEDFRLMNDGRYIYMLAQEKSGVKFEKVNRKWHQKILGFRSGVRWKQITAIIGYLLMISIFNALFGNGNVAEFIMFVVTFAIFFSIVALVKGKFLFFGIPNRKMAGIIIGAGFLIMIIMPLPETTSETEDSLTASEQVEAEEERQEAKEQLEKEAAEEKAAEEKKAAEEEQKVEEAAAQKAEEEAKAEEIAAKQAADEKEAAKKAEEEKQAEEAAAKKAAEEQKAKEEAKAKKEAEKAKAAQKEKEKKEAEAKAAAEKKKKASQTNAVVSRVIDGDTIEVNMNGNTETVRLLLVDTPETVHPSEPVQPFGPEASQFVKNTLSGKEVRVKVGTEERDNYGRLLAYIFINGETIQEMLLREGLARTAYLYNDLTMLDQFHAVQQTAIDGGKGVWSISGYAHADHDHGYHYEEKTAPAPEPEPVPAPAPAPATKPKAEAPASVYYKNCTAVREAGANPVRTGDPGYAKHLDRDGDGVGCE